METNPNLRFSAKDLIRHLPPLALFLALTLWVAWPIWVEPASRIQNYGDPLLNAYILHWVQHALFRQIYDFFQANYFWNHDSSLAYGEHLIAPAVLALPGRLFTDRAAAIHNFSSLEAFFFSAAAAYLLAWTHFRSRTAAALAGLAYGFALYRINQISHIQLIHGEFFPLMILGFEKSLRSRVRLWKWLLGAAALAQWLTSWYWFVFSVVGFGSYAAARLWGERRELSGRKIVGVCAPLLLAGLAVVPAALPYLELKKKNVLIRPEIESESFSARALDFLAPPERSLLYGALPVFSSLQTDERRLFPGLTVGFGFLLALGAWRREKAGNAERKAKAPDDSRLPFPAGLWIFITLAMLVFGFGYGRAVSVGEREFFIPFPYLLLKQLVPVLGEMRVAARWMLPASLGFALLLAYAWRHWMETQARPAKTRKTGAAFVLIFLTLEILTRPLPFKPLPADPPPVYAWLDEQPWPSPVVELPILQLDDNRQMLHATWHSQPVVNGTNGYYPPEQRQLYVDLARFPAPGVVQQLKQKEVRFAIVDPAQYGSRWQFKTDPNYYREALGPNAKVFTIGRHIVIDLNSL